MKHFITIILIYSFVAGCQKEIRFGDGNGQASLLKCTSCSYLPVCDSTQLTYIDSTAAGVDTIKSTLAILGDTTINGKKFTRVSPSAVFSQGLLYNCDAGEYRIYQPFPDLGIDVDSLIQSLGLPFPIGTVPIPSKIETTILKANAPAGATWSDTVFSFAPLPIFTIVAKLDYKIEAKGVQRSVLGKVYSKVIHVSSKLNFSVPIVTIPISFSVDYYFAEGIGIIETKVVNNGMLQAQSKLYQYKIK